MPFASLGSRISVHYEVAGTGPPLVLVHGISGSGAAWQRARERLEGHFTIITPDLSGSGDTQDAGTALSVGLLADEVAAVVEAVRLGPAHVVGHSVGGVVAGAAAGRHPHLVRSAVLHGSWKATDTRLRALFRLFGELYEQSPRRFAELIVLMSFDSAFLNAFPDDDSFQDWVDVMTAGLAPGTDRQLELLLGVDNSGELARIQGPALIVGSDEDHVFPREHHRAVLEAVPDAREAVIRGGHSAPWESIDTFLSPIVGFIDDTAHEQTRTAV